MEHIRSIEELAHWKSKEREKKTGFVPTMGALHVGHLSLVRLSQSISDRTLVSIYVNPTQFNKAEDLAAYPDTLEADLRALEALGCDAVFLPSAQMLYPDGLKSRRFNFNQLDHSMEGAGRPGHFEGMATVVTRFFELIEPDFAVFGEKDYQQLQVIRRMARDLDIPTEILGAPTIREHDGLAMSSRNRYLSEDERPRAGTLFSAISDIARATAEGADPAPLCDAAARQLTEAGFREVDYVTVRDANTLEQYRCSGGPGRVLAAAWLGKARLIDNVAV